MLLYDQVMRAFLGVSDKATRSLFDGSLVLSTDVGLVRLKNEDRAAFAKVSRSDGEPALNLLALSDGMGGMAEGATCATMALAAFFEDACTGGANRRPEEILESASFAANDAVYTKFGGRGGATLSAVAWLNHREISIVNVGDSRVFHQSGAISEKLKRLTIDDTMREAFGGDGKELIQFIGLGKGMRPHTSTLHASGHIILTTDGIHFIDHSLLGEITNRASTAKSKADRAIALSRWLGGPDNATIAVVDLDNFPSLVAAPSPLLEIWPCGADVVNVWSTPLDNQGSRDLQGKSIREIEPVGEKQTRKRKAVKRKPKEVMQGRLQIEINVDEGENAGRE